MAFVITKIISRSYIKPLEDKLLNLTISCGSVRERNTLPRQPKLRNPTWFTKKERTGHDDSVTKENREFMKEVVEDRFKNQDAQSEPVTDVEWKPQLQRTGLIARKIGTYPMWLNNGKKISTTLLQILDNNVIKYYTPEDFNPPRARVEKVYNKKGVVLLGAEAADPCTLTREYCGIFKDSGVIPKKILARFFVSPDAALSPGTPLNVMHFKVGNFVDVRGQTMYRGFQGVMKRHGFSGMPASHGVTKTHRRAGNIGGGGAKGRVWPGTKLAGHMGNRYRILRGLKIWRINTKYNVMYVSGQNIPGSTNSIVYIYDSKIFPKRPSEPVPFPTYFGNMDELPEDIYDDEVHKFAESSIVFK